MSERKLKRLVVQKSVTADLKAGDIITIEGYYEDRWYDPSLRWISRKWWHLRCLVWEP